MRPGRVALRAVLGGVLAGAMVLTPQLALAEPTGPADSAPAEAQAADVQVATATSVAVPVVSDRAVYILGEAAPVSASVRAVPDGGAEESGPPRGSVEFFDGDVSLGAAEVVEDGVAARAGLETDLWPASGAREITAVFTPDDGSAFAPSTSAARTYRIVDTTRVVPDIELQGDAAAEIGDASLEWTIGNIWFSNFRVGFEREALDGDVSLPDIPHPGSAASDEELQRYYFRAFTFSEGRGERDAAGNRVVSFEGAARLTSGSANQWDFTDPRVHISPGGDGYITAEFTGFYDVGSSHQEYGPARVTIATFSGAEIAPAADGEDGRVEAAIPLNWEGQAKGAGTWFYDYDDSFPNEFVALLGPLVAPFFARSAVATDDSKIPHPITLSFDETVAEEPPEPVTAPEIVSGPASQTVSEGEDATFAVEARGEDLSYRWQRAEAAVDGDPEFTDVSGATEKSVTTSGVGREDDGAQYRVVVANGAGEEISDPAMLTVEPADAEEPPPGGPTPGDRADEESGGATSGPDEPAAKAAHSRSTEDLAETGWPDAASAAVLAALAAVVALSGGVLLARRRS